MGVGAEKWEGRALRLVPGELEGCIQFTLYAAWI